MSRPTIWMRKRWNCWKRWWRTTPARCCWSVMTERFSTMSSPARWCSKATAESTSMWAATATGCGSEKPQLPTPAARGRSRAPPLRWLPRARRRESGGRDSQGAAPLIQRAARACAAAREDSASGSRTGCSCTTLISDPIVFQRNKDQGSAALQRLRSLPTELEHAHTRAGRRSTPSGEGSA